MVSVALIKAFLCVVFGFCTFTLGIAFEGIVNDELTFKDGAAFACITLIGLLCAYKLVTL